MLLRIHQVAGAHTGRVWTFDQAVVRVGRMPDSDVAFDAHADLDASGRHLEIVRRGGAWVVRDAGSRNGTYVNGEQIAERLLADGDMIECGFGGPRLRVELVDPRAHSGSPSANTEAVPIARPNAPTAAAEALPPVSGGPPTGGRQSPAGERISGDEPTEVAPAVSRPPQVSGSAATEAGPSLSPPVAETGPMQGPAWGASAPAGAPPTGRPPAPASAPPASAPPASASPGSAAEAPPEGGDRRYGQRTVGMMIGDAIQGLRQKHEVSQRRWKIAAGCVGSLFGVLCLALAAYLLSRPAQAPVPDIAAITASTRPALWRLVGADDASFCTGFAVRRDLIATSGRCVLAVEARQAGGKPVSLVGEGGTYPVARMWRHPETPTGTATGGVDVGLLAIDGSAPAMVSLATPQQLGGLREGTQLVVYGYSSAGAMAQPITLQGGNGQLRYPGPAPYGAPLLDASGTVVGLHGGLPAGPTGPGEGVRVDGLLGLLAGLGR